MKYTRENIVEGINAKLNEMYGGNKTFSGLLKLYKQELPNYPIEVEQNVLEWLNDLPITEIDCHGISIKYVLDNFGTSIDDFPIVLRNFVSFAQGGFKNKIICSMCLRQF